MIPAVTIQVQYLMALLASVVRWEENKRTEKNKTYHELVIKSFFLRENSKAPPDHFFL